MSIGQGQDGDMTALLALHCRRKKGDCQRMLVIIRNKSSFDGVADRLPPLVVLIENMPAFHGGMLINDQHGPLKKRQFLSTRLIAVQQPPNGIAEPVWALIPAMGQQRIDRDMEPAIAKGLHAARYIHGWQNRLFRKAPLPGAYRSQSFRSSRVAASNCSIVCSNVFCSLFGFICPPSVRATREPVCRKALPISS